MISKTSKGRFSKNLYSIFYYKRYVEQAMMYPFVLLGKCIALIKPLRQQYDVFFFFPSYGIGGAERVNAEILNAVAVICRIFCEEDNYFFVGNCI